MFSLRVAFPPVFFSKFGAKKRGHFWLINHEFFKSNMVALTALSVWDTDRYVFETEVFKIVR